MSNKIFSKEELLKNLKEGKEITVSRKDYTPTSFFIDKNDKVYFHNKDITSSKYREHPNTLSEMLNFFESIQKENFNIEISEKNIEQGKNSIFDLFLKTKGITKKEYETLNLNYSDEEIKFIDEMAEKYPGGSVNKKDPSDEFIQFVAKEIEKSDYVPSFPIILMKNRDVEFSKYEIEGESFYSVDINNTSIGLTICFTNDLERAVKIYEKEKFFNRIQRVDDEIVCKVNGVTSIYGESFNKVILCEESLNIYGRSASLIMYFKNELENVNEYFPDEEQKEEKKMFIKNTNEIIEELKDSKDQLEPLYLFVHPMDNAFHIANKEEQLENIKNLYDNVYEELLELSDSEEQG